MEYKLTCVENCGEFVKPKYVLDQMLLVQKGLRLNHPGNDKCLVTNTRLINP